MLYYNMIYFRRLQLFYTRRVETLLSTTTRSFARSQSKSTNARRIWHPSMLEGQVRLQCQYFPLRSWSRRRCSLAQTFTRSFESGQNRLFICQNQIGTIASVHGLTVKRSAMIPGSTFTRYVDQTRVIPRLVSLFLNLLLLLSVNSPSVI